MAGKGVGHVSGVRGAREQSKPGVNGKVTYMQADQGIPGRCSHGGAEPRVK